MKLKIGDKVRYLNEVGGGVIVKIIDKKTVEISDDSGFDIPVLISDLVSVDSSEDVLVEVEEESLNEVDENEIVLDDDLVSFDSNEDTGEIKIFIAVVKNDANFDMFLINDSSFNLFCNIITPLSEKYKSIYSNSIEPNTKIKIKTYSESDVQDGISVINQIIFYKQIYKELQSPIETSVDIKAIKFAKTSSFKENDYFHKDALLFDVFEFSLNSELNKLSKDDMYKIVKQKQESEDYVKQLSTKYKTKRTVEIVEVDLHIQQLIDNYKHLPNGEIVEIQLERFHSELNDAIKNKVKKIVFIHGVGKGTLKNELRRSLEREYSKFKFQDASFKEYGYGATMVYL